LTFTPADTLTASQEKESGSRCFHSVALITWHVFANATWKSAAGPVPAREASRVPTSGAPTRILPNCHFSKELTRQCPGFAQKRTCVGYYESSAVRRWIIRSRHGFRKQAPHARMRILSALVAQSESGWSLITAGDGREDGNDIRVFLRMSTICFTSFFFQQCKESNED